MLFGKKKRRITRLLIVEDEPLVAFDTEHFLRESEFEIVATLDRVADAMAAIRRAVDRREDIDLLLLDVNLADGSGLDVAHAARAAGIPVMFVTGECPADAANVAIGCLSKPYALRTLLAAINAVEAALDGTMPKRLPGGFRLFPVAA